MLPPGSNSPIIIGMRERKERQLIQGNYYQVFFKGHKYIGIYKAIFDNDCIVIETYATNPEVDAGKPFRVHMIFDRKWIFELGELDIFFS